LQSLPRPFPVASFRLNHRQAQAGWLFDAGKTVEWQTNGGQAASPGKIRKEGSFGG
jgi:hypothetical protein